MARGESQTIPLPSVMHTDYPSRGVRHQRLPKDHHIREIRLPGARKSWPGRPWPWQDFLEQWVPATEMPDGTLASLLALSPDALPPATAADLVETALHASGFDTWRGLIRHRRNGVPRDGLVFYGLVVCAACADAGRHLTCVSTVSTDQEQAA